MMENGNLDKLTFYNLHFHTNWATFRAAVKFIIFLAFVDRKIIQLYFKRLLETIYNRSKMSCLISDSSWFHVPRMKTGWGAVARCDLCPPMTMASDQPPAPASGVKADPASSSSDFKPIQPDPIYAPVRQRWVIKQNYFVIMLETPALPSSRWGEAEKLRRGRECLTMAGKTGKKLNTA